MVDVVAIIDRKLQLDELKKKEKIYRINRQTKRLRSMMNHKNMISNSSSIFIRHLEVLVSQMFCCIAIYMDDKACQKLNQFYISSLQILVSQNVSNGLVSIIFQALQHLCL